MLGAVIGDLVGSRFEWDNQAARRKPCRTDPHGGPIAITVIRPGIIRKNPPVKSGPITAIRIITAILL